MSRYIDADILSDALRHLTLGETDAARATMKITHYVSRMPTADVRENVKGKWIIKTDGFVIKRVWGVCSECGNTLDFSGVNAGRGDANFCPNCGADMRVDQT